MIQDPVYADLTPLWEAVGRQFRLDVDSPHGPRHWGKVESIALRLAPHTGADKLVVRLFAVLHDSQRDDGNVEVGHGSRAAEFATQQRGQSYQLDDERFALLLEACEKHDTGAVHSDPTIGTCWDADRLDLVRHGVWPELKYISTARVQGMLTGDEDALRLFLRT